VGRTTLQGALCFLANSGWYGAEDSASIRAVRFDEPIAGPEPNEEIVRARQYDAAGIELYPPEVVLDFIGGELKSVVGTLADDTAIPIRTPPSRSNVQGKLRFNIGSLRYERVLTSTATSMRTVLDAETGEVVSEESTVLYANAPKLIKTWDFSNDVVVPGSAPRTVKSTTMDVSASGSTYLHDADRYGDGYVGSARYSPTISSIPNQGNNKTDVCSPTYYATIAAPMTAEPWANTLDSEYIRYVGQAFYWLSAVNDYRLHWSAGFGGTQTALPLSLLVSKCVVQGSNYGGGTITLGAETRQTADQGSLNSTLNLDDMVHEYGHYIHDRYGNKGSAAVKEGFADTMGRRWVMYAREFRGEFSVANYFSFGYKHGTASVNGEILAAPEGQYVGNGICATSR